MRLLILLFGCEGVMPGFDWQQMNQQHKFQPFEACEYFPDGRAMQAPPQGTVARETSAGDIPPLTRELFAQGRRSFETYCAACHGIDGSGQSEVARNMDLRKPPSLVKESIQSQSPAQIFETVSKGYGLMPSFAHELSVRERWGTIWYLKALQRSRSVNLEELPADIRAQAWSELQP